MRTSGRPGVHRDVAELAHRSWASRSYPEAVAELLTLGWLPCGSGGPGLPPGRARRAAGRLDRPAQLTRRA